MAHFVGLDVSVQETAVCVVDEAGEVMFEQKVATELDDLVGLLMSFSRDYARIGIEAGPLVNGCMPARRSSFRMRARPAGMQPSRRPSQTRRRHWTFSGSIRTRRRRCPPTARSRHTFRALRLAARFTRKKWAGQTSDPNR